MVLAHARALLTSDPAGATDYLDADLRDVSGLLDRAGETLDLTRPAAVMLVSVLHMIPDREDPHLLVARLMSAMPGGRPESAASASTQWGGAGQKL